MDLRADFARSRERRFLEDAQALGFLDHVSLFRRFYHSAYFLAQQIVRRISKDQRFFGRQLLVKPAGRRRAAYRGAVHRFLRSICRAKNAQQNVPARNAGRSFSRRPGRKGRTRIKKAFDF